jgi:hypothetical protein
VKDTGPALPVPCEAAESGVRPSSARRHGRGVGEPQSSSAGVADRSLEKVQHGLGERVLEQPVRLVARAAHGVDHGLDRRVALERPAALLLLVADSFAARLDLVGYRHRQMAALPLGAALLLDAKQDQARRLRRLDEQAVTYLEDPKGESLPPMSRVASL